MVSIEILIYILLHWYHDSFFPKLPGCLHLSSLLSRRPSPPLCLVALSCGCVALFTHPQRLHAPDRTVDGARSTTINATPTQPSASFTAYGTRVSVCKKKSWLRRVGAEQFMLHCASGVVLAPAAPPLVFVLDSSPAPKLPPPPFSNAESQAAAVLWRSAH